MVPTCEKGAGSSGCRQQVSFKVDCVQRTIRGDLYVHKCAKVLKRVLGMLILPALVMAGIAAIAPNPDGALALGLACMFGANYFFSRDPNTR